MLKKRLLICLALLAAFLVANLLITQAAGEGDLTFILNSSGDGYVVSKCVSTASGDLSIPSTHSGKPVVEIGREAFLDCTKLTSITIPSSVTSIDWYAFSGCTGLTSITIPDSVTTIDWFAFYGCTNLTTAAIGDGVTCIDAAVFSGCTKLSNVSIGKAVTTIGWSAFKDCTSLIDINIPSSVDTIERYAFYGCDQLSNIVYCGSDEQWDAITVADGNDLLDDVTLEFHRYENGICEVCQEREHKVSDILGDIDVNNTVDYNDAVYLLLHTIFDEEAYPIYDAPADFDGNGTVDQNDAVYLLLYTLFGEKFYPLSSQNV